MSVSQIMDKNTAGLSTEVHGIEMDSFSAGYESPSTVRMFPIPA